MHWSEEIAIRAIKRVGLERDIVVGSGISLSGPVHVGHSREFLTAALVAHAIVARGGKVRFIAFSDDMDPLRKVYPFLPQEYCRWVGCPLYRIPDPYGCHGNYAGHYLEELLSGFTALGINPEVLMSSTLYNSGTFSDLVVLTLAERTTVNDILDRTVIESGGDPRKSKKDWPFQPECPSCMSVQSTRVIALDGKKLTIHCESCNNEYVVDLEQGGGKLIWRCDWPMRWKYLNVAVEPFGHDHNASGGSYESGVSLAKELYGNEPPIPVPYGWVHFKNGQAMHSSSGKAISITQLTAAYPPEIIWWMLARREPHSVISFDSESTLLEEARLLRDTKKSGSASDALRVVESIVGISPALIEYPLDHLVLVAQLANFEPAVAMKILRRSEAYSNASVPISNKDMMFIRNWLDLFDTNHHVTVRNIGDPIPGTRPELRPVLDTLVSAMIQVAWNAQSVHDTVHQTAKDAGVKVNELFAELYRHVIGQEQGPKIGWLFETLGRSKILQLLA
jgi:lysyl-tRNA synthetase, class I